MITALNLQHLALLKFGIAVPNQHREEVLKLIKGNPTYKEQFQNIKNGLNTMTNEDDFLDVVTLDTQAIASSHSKISEIAENNKVIVRRDNTYQIRAINPQHIASLTQRAFFNSFNLERSIRNDQDEENTRKTTQNTQRQEEKQAKEKPERQVKKGENEEEDKCICGKTIPDSLWIQCCNENKCRGSGWYHVDCVGISGKPEEIARIQFTCEHCRHQQADKEEESSKRFKSNNDKA